MKTKDPGAMPQQHSRRRHLLTSILTGISLAGVTTSSGVTFEGIGALARHSKDKLLDPPRVLAESRASALSADGSTVVGGTVTEDGEKLSWQAFSWTQKTGIKGLGTLEGLSSSMATAVSDDGSVIAGSSNGPPTKQQACIWTTNGEITGLGTLNLEGRTKVSRAYGISGDGKFVVGESLINRGSHAFRWNLESGMVDLGDLSGFNQQSKGVDASEDGSVVVGYGSSSHLEAMRWDEDHGMIGLGSLPGGRGWSNANAVSANGTMVVGASSPSSDPWEAEAFLWTAERGMQALGDLPGNLVYSKAHAISAEGRIIVGRGYGNAPHTEAILWNQERQIHIISELLEEAGIDTNGWILSVAIDVSADGMVIAGNGINPGGFYEGWVANFRDTAPPVILDAEVIGAERHRKNSFLDVTFEVTAQDDSGAADWYIEDVESNHPKHDYRDLLIVGDTTVRVSSHGHGNKRTFTATLRAVDASGNISEGYQISFQIGNHSWSRNHDKLTRSDRRSPPSKLPTGKQHQRHSSARGISR